MTIEPGIAINVYFVQILQEISISFSRKKHTYSVIKAAFQRMVANVAVNIVVPTHHCPPECPLVNTESSAKAAIPKK